MKKTLLTSIAVLFLATGTAHAQTTDADQWGQRPLAKMILTCGSITGHFETDQAPRVATAKSHGYPLEPLLRFEIEPRPDIKPAIPHWLTIRYSRKTGKIWINGKQCKMGE
jgi:hypothetical protein